MKYPKYPIPLCAFDCTTNTGDVSHHISRLSYAFLGIFLSGFKLNAEEVDRRLKFIDENDGGLPLEIIISLKR